MSISYTMKRKLIRKYLWAIVILVAVIYNEWIVYRWSKSVYWPAARFGQNDNVITLLIVADPQIQGYMDESQLFGSITRWDSDRYLSKGFSLALDHVNPDAILFLGDLFDEGSRSSDSEFAEYFERFQSIFNVTPSLPWIVISGDNDIGGEGMDSQTPYKIRRFEKYFGSLGGVYKLKFLDIIKLNYFRSNTWQRKPDEEMLNLKQNLRSGLRLLLNHENIITGSSGFYKPIFQHLKPNLIVTGHSHMSFAYGCERCWEGADFIRSPVLNGLASPEEITDYFMNLPVNIHDSQWPVIEIGVPTCSYRMGVPHMAYGALEINSKAAAHYRNLWLPSRFLSLIIYVIALVLAVILIVTNKR